MRVSSGPALPELPNGRPTNVQLAWFLRRGPYVLLVLGSIAAALSVESIGTSEAGVITMAVLVPTLAALHWICADRRWVDGDLQDTLGRFYVLTRTVVAFVITWLNPFFSIFALIGYFDNQLYVPRRWGIAVLLCTAVTMAGAQSGGLPPDGALQLVLFLGLLALNGVLTVVMTNADAHEAEIAEERNTTIAMLEETNVRLEQALAENAGLQAQLVQQARESGVHDERERLALEIHDTIAQNLTGIVTQLQAVTDTTDDAAGRDHVKRAADLAREALGEARRSVQGLLPLRLDSADLVDALAHLTRDWSAATGIAGDLVVTGEAERLHQDIEATVLRIAQEAMTNVSKHAQARRVGVTLSYTDDELVLDVRDDGIGFDPGAAPTPDGHGVGLHGMEQRAARVAGALVVESEPGAGTAISLRVPSVVPHG
jgi:signal transduction histidine kinase